MAWPQAVVLRLALGAVACGLALGVTSSAPATTTAAAGLSLRVALDQPGGPAVVRKVQGYNSGLVTLDRYVRDLPLVARLGFDTMRVDVGLGWPGPAVVPGSHMAGIFGTVIGGHRGATYNVSVVLELTRLLHEHGMTPLYSWAYVAAPFQSKAGDYTSPPRDLDAWRAMHRQLLAPLEAAQLPVISEMYNEPDLSWSFTGNWSEYLDMYEAGCKGVTDASPGGLVVGPATAINGVSDLTALLQRVAEKDLRMDALTIHSYGGSSAWKPAIGRARTALASSAAPHLRSLPISVNEFNALAVRRLATLTLTHRSSAMRVPRPSVAS